MPLLLLLYVRFVDGYECWGGFSKRGFENWWPMVCLYFCFVILYSHDILAKDTKIMTLAAT